MGLKARELDHDSILHRLRALHRAMRDHLHQHLRTTAIEQMSAATELRGGDTIYSLDTESEEILYSFCEVWGRDTPFLLVAEGLPGGSETFGCSQPDQADFTLICDPIDGTRPLMYDKRSAWLLTGIARNHGPDTNLSHIEVAMQTELPTSKMTFSDSVWAVEGQGACGMTENLVTGDEQAFKPRPSSATTIEGGFAMFSKFFPGSKGWLAQLEEQLLLEVLGPPVDGQPQTFDDQYISNGGQIYDLMTGRDRFNAELRPLAHLAMHGGSSLRLCSHPYDVCTELIAREAGVIITDEHGDRLTAPLDVESPVSWIGYANSAIRAQLEPTLLRLLGTG